MLFDGVCNLCNGAVQFIIRRDPHGVFKFAALQSDAAAELLESQPALRGLPDSIVLVEAGRVHVRSSAVLRIARRLSWPWPLCWALMIVPRCVRDWAYAGVARNRYRWFGRKDQCMTPTEELKGRFLG